MPLGPEAFGEDYLYFYEAALDDERSDAEAEVVWRVLGLEADREVLDLACGHGRIANRLAGRGARVIGVDADGFFLETTRRDAAARGVGVEYIQGDMRDLAWDGRFDAALLWFTAFGYFDDAGNRAVLEGLRRALKPGGRLVVELNHLPWILAHRQRQLFQRRGADVMLDVNTWKPATSEMQTHRTILRDGAVRELDYSLRMYMPAELASWLTAAGFRQASALGASGEPLTAADARLLMVAEA